MLDEDCGSEEPGTQHLRISWYFLGFRLNVFLADWDYEAEVPGKLSSQEK